MNQSNEFFTARLLAELDGKPSLEALEEALRESRKVGFDYVDDQEAFDHFRSEADELEEAFFNESPENAVGEAADIQFLLAELVRRRGGSFSDATRENTRKFLKRLNFVEEDLKSRGLTWADVKWPDDVQPIWIRAKAAGL